jgi:hypothetical protein
MKVNVNVDCTPDEARKFLGLPDVQPFQNEMMKIMREKTLDGLKMMEPNEAMKMWGPMMNQGMSQGMDFFKSMMSGAASSALHKKASKK